MSGNLFRPPPRKRKRHIANARRSRRPGRFIASHQRASERHDPESGPSNIDAGNAVSSQLIGYRYGTDCIRISATEETAGDPTSRKTTEYLIDANNPYGHKKSSGPLNGRIIECLEHGTTETRPKSVSDGLAKAALRR